jgi:hypothetical protein
MDENISDTFTHAKRYSEMGWALVGIPAGSKAPSTFGWQQRATPPGYWQRNPAHNIGLLHSLSGTCALDIDHMAHTRLIFDALNIDLDDILASAPRIVGRPDRGKVLFKVPDGVDLTTRKISWPVEGDFRRTEVVFELRAGSVQDVLPPSIHPDTGNEYRWAGTPPESIGDIPDQLLTIWTEWDRFRPQLMDLCPWKTKPEFRPPEKPRRMPAEGQNAIAAYNDATPIKMALEQAGYRQFGNRYLSPNSTSKIPGVVIFDDGRAYSHHASDPFDPTHSFDAFDVFCHYQHLGNVSAAVKAAAEMLDIKALPQAPTDQEREYQKHGARVSEIIMKGTPRRSEPTGKIPHHLLTVPGVLGEVVTYSARTCIREQPQFDVQTALALGSVAMGRRFITDNRNMSGLYFLNVAKTGTGKEHANTVIEDVLEAAGLIDLRGPNGYTSATGVLSTLRDKPVHLTVIDEFGSYLQSAAAKGNQHRADAMVMLMEAFGRQTKTLRNLGYATLSLTDAQKKSMQVEVRSPSITLIGMTTPETFYDAIGSKDVASGFLNRLLIVESKRPRQLSRSPENVDVPSAVVSWVKASASAVSEHAGDLSDHGHEFPPDPVLVPFSATARSLFADYEQTIIDRQNAMDQAVLADMMNRSREIAMRLSLIVAHSLGEREINEIAAQWAIDYVDFYLRQTLEAMAVNISEGGTDEIRKKIAQAIQDAGSAGLKISELIKNVPKLGNLKKHERDGALAMVCEDFPVERLVQTPEGGKGRPAIIHRWIGEA